MSGSERVVVGEGGMGERDSVCVCVCRPASVRQQGGRWLNPIGGLPPPLLPPGLGEEKMELGETGSPPLFPLSSSSSSSGNPF